MQRFFAAVCAEIFHICSFCAAFGFFTCLIWINFIATVGEWDDGSMEIIHMISSSRMVLILFFSVSCVFIVVAIAFSPWFSITFITKIVMCIVINSLGSGIHTRECMFACVCMQWKWDWKIMQSASFACVLAFFFCI